MNQFIPYSVQETQGQHQDKIKEILCTHLTWAPNKQSTWILTGKA